MRDCRFSDGLGSRKPQRWRCVPGFACPRAFLSSAGRRPRRSGHEGNERFTDKVGSTDYSRGRHRSNWKEKCGLRILIAFCGNFFDDVFMVCSNCGNFKKAFVHTDTKDQNFEEVEIQRSNISQSPTHTLHLTSLCGYSLSHGSRSAKHPNRLLRVSSFGSSLSPHALPGTPYSPCPGCDVTASTAPAASPSSARRSQGRKPGQASF